MTTMSHFTFQHLHMSSAYPLITTSYMHTVCQIMYDPFSPIQIRKIGTLCTKRCSIPVMQAKRLVCWILERYGQQFWLLTDPAHCLQQKNQALLYAHLQPGFGCVCVSSFEFAFSYELEHLPAGAVCLK